IAEADHASVPGPAERFQPGSGFAGPHDDRTVARDAAGDAVENSAGQVTQSFHATADAERFVSGSGIGTPHESRTVGRDAEGDAVEFSPGRSPGRPRPSCASRRTLDFRKR